MTVPGRKSEPSGLRSTTKLAGGRPLGSTSTSTVWPLVKSAASAVVVRHGHHTSEPMGSSSGSAHHSGRPRRVAGITGAGVVGRLAITGVTRRATGALGAIVAGAGPPGDAVAFDAQLAAVPPQAVHPEVTVNPPERTGVIEGVEKVVEERVTEGAGVKAERLRVDGKRRFNHPLSTLLAAG